MYGRMVIWFHCFPCEGGCLCCRRVKTSGSLALVVTHRLFDLRTLHFAMTGSAPFVGKDMAPCEGGGGLVLAADTQW